LLLKARRHDEALPHLKIARSILGSDPASALGLAQCLEGLGGDASVKEADELYRDIIRDHPGTPFDEIARTARTERAQSSVRRAVGGGLRPDVMMYIAGALKTFRKIGDGPTREIAAEVAMLGTRGLEINDPTPKYRLRTLPGEFSGLHALAIMYTAFKQIDPTMDSGVDFSREYDAAQLISVSED